MDKKQENFFDSLVWKTTKFLVGVHSWIQKQWLLTSFLISTTSFWFSLVLAFWGENLKLIEYEASGKRTLTVFGSILTLLIIVWSFLVVAAQKVSEYEKNKDPDMIKYKICQIVDPSIERVCNNKYKTLIDLIKEIDDGHEKPKVIISKPCEQLKAITREITESIQSLLLFNGNAINNNDIYVNILYKFYTFNKWDQAYTHAVEKGMNIDDVVSNPDSTFSQTLKDKNGYSFWASKEQAKREHHYIADICDKYDKDDNLKGSILCYRLHCQYNGITYIDAMISVSTYDKGFLNDFDPFGNNLKAEEQREDFLKYNIRESILKVFEKRINIELCLLYLSELYRTRARKNNTNDTIQVPPKISNVKVNS